MSCAELQVWSRCDADASGAVARALWEERSLVRTWCMRGTLHLLTPRQLSTYASAFDPDDYYNSTWMRAFKLTAGDMARIQEAVVESLDGHAMTRRQLADAVAARVGERLGARLKSSWGELLKPAARRGLIVNGPSRGQEITYVRADQWVGGLALEDRAEARKELLRGYLRAYGPATKKDYARWLGIRPMRPINETFSQLGSEIAEVKVADRSMFALREDLGELGGSPPLAEGPPVRLLGGFDCYLLGHADRDHLATGEQRPLIYRTAGWVSPTVLVGGVVRGIWEHGLESGQLAIRVSPFGRLSPSELGGLRAEAERLAHFFDRPLALYT